MAPSRFVRSITSLALAASITVGLAGLATPASAAGLIDLQSLQFNAPITMRAGQQNMFSAFYRHTDVGSLPQGTAFTVQLPTGFIVDTSKPINFRATTVHGLIPMASGCGAKGTVITCRTTQELPGRTDTGANELAIEVFVRVPNTPGDHIASYTADPFNQVAEKNEQNNRATRTIRVVN